MAMKKPFESIFTESEGISVNIPNMYNQVISELHLTEQAMCQGNNS